MSEPGSQGRQKVSAVIRVQRIREGPFFGHSEVDAAVCFQVSTVFRKFIAVL